MTKEELLDKIINWESENGESFNDYFSHDKIDARNWAYYLSQTGHEDISLMINEECDKNSRGWCLDQELMFEIYPCYDEDGKFNAQNYNANFSILVNYFFERGELLQEVIEFLNQEEF